MVCLLMIENYCSRYFQILDLLLSDLTGVKTPVDPYLFVRYGYLTIFSTLFVYWRYFFKGANIAFN